jgi:hypothetical protein
MPELLVLSSAVRCDHDGKVDNKESQRWVVVGGDDPVLRNDDPEGRDIDWCPNQGANIKKCGKTLKVEQGKGYSKFVRLGGRAVVMANLQGKTEGTPPGFVSYRVRDPGQRFIVVEA